MPSVGNRTIGNSEVIASENQAICYYRHLMLLSENKLYQREYSIFPKWKEQLMNSYD